MSLTENAAILHYTTCAIIFLEPDPHLASKLKISEPLQSHSSLLYLYYILGCLTQLSRLYAFEILTV